MAKRAWKLQPARAGIAHSHAGGVAIIHARTDVSEAGGRPAPDAIRHPRPSRRRWACVGPRQALLTRQLPSARRLANAAPPGAGQRRRDV